MQDPTVTTPQSVDTRLPAIEDTKRLVDAYLTMLFEERIAQANSVSKNYTTLWQSIARLSSAGGKRLRPYMLLLAYNMYAPDKQISSVVPAAAAQELIHLAMLIHDDIIDRDEVRYGVKNISGQYNETYAPYIADLNERHHFSTSAAIMAGDLLIAEAHTALGRCAIGNESLSAAQQILSKAIFSVVGGELLDAESTFRPRAEIDSLTIAREKTASYSFVSPLVTGATLAGAPAAIIDGLASFGTALGIAYQLQDDVLSMFGDELITGKSTSSDIVEGKYTYLIETFYTRASPQQSERMNEIFGNRQATSVDIQTARELLIDTGALQVVTEEITRLAADATNALNNIPMSDASHEAFASLVELSIRRVK